MERRVNVNRPSTVLRWRGFTLVEMLIVLTIVGLMTAVVVPYYLRESPGEHTTRAAYEVAQAMRLARYRAISQNRAVYFDFEAGGKDAFYTAYVNLGNPGEVPTGAPAEIDATRIPGFNDVGVGQRGALLPEDVAFSTGAASSGPGGGAASSALDLPSNPLVFNSRGTVIWPAGGLLEGTVYISHSARAEEVRAVTIGRTGIVKVWRLKGGVWQ